MSNGVGSSIGRPVEGPYSEVGSTVFGSMTEIGRRT